MDIFFKVGFLLKGCNEAQTVSCKSCWRCSHNRDNVYMVKYIHLNFLCCIWAGEWGITKRVLMMRSCCTAKKYVVLTELHSTTVPQKNVLTSNFIQCSLKLYMKTICWVGEVECSVIRICRVWPSLLGWLKITETGSQ